MLLHELSVAPDVSLSIGFKHDTGGNHLSYWGEDGGALEGGALWRRIYQCTRKINDVILEVVTNRSERKGCLDKVERSRSPGL